jgi:ParB family chromosome partitioning protein
MGHARALIGLSGVQQIMLAEQIVQNELSVREVEKLVKKQTDPSHSPQKNIHKTEQSSDVLRLQEALSEQLGAAVAIKASANGSGSLKISYSSLDQLDEIISKISR